MTAKKLSLFLTSLQSLAQHYGHHTAQYSVLIFNLMNIFVQNLFYWVLLDIYGKLLDAGQEPSNPGLSSKMLDGWQH